MKKAFIVLLFLASCATSATLENEVEVPTAVKRAFDKTFPKADHVSWTQNEDDYEASFYQRGEVMTTTYTSAGAVKETERRIQDYILPEAARQYLRAHYGSAAIDEAAEITAADGTTNYEVEVKGTVILFDERGNFLKAAKQ